MKLTILSLLFTSCASYTGTTYRITTKTMTCPENYLYNAKDGMCYYSLPKYTPNNSLSPKLESFLKKTVKHTNKPKKPLKDPEEVSCIKAISKMRQCGMGI